jgi:hypothetical protein
MKLNSAAGNTFELVVVGYEHPDITEGLWESNWLVVSGAVTRDDESWSFVVPCVTTFELTDLAEWLEKLADGAADPPQIAFTEPNLEFSYSHVVAPVLRVRFAHASAPPRMKYSDEAVEGVVLEFPLAELDPRAAAADVRNALMDFPIRGGAA